MPFTPDVIRFHPTSSDVVLSYDVSEKKVIYILDMKAVYYFNIIL